MRSVEFLNTQWFIYRELSATEVESEYTNGTAIARTMRYHNLRLVLLRGLGVHNPNVVLPNHQPPNVICAFRKISTSNIRTINEFNIAFMISKT
jgi:hypothetical protein